MVTSNYSDPLRATADDQDTRDKARPVLEGLREAGETAKRVAAENWETFQDSASGYLELGREKAREMGEVVQEKVRREPTKALAIATIAGFALGLLWMRR
jgi:hypothetical protein